MGNEKNLMQWVEEQTAQVPDRGVTELALKIFNQIDAEMKRQGITQTELARRAQVNRAFVSRILNNPGNVTLSTIVALANALDMEVQVPELTPRTLYVVPLDLLEWLTDPEAEEGASHAESEGAVAA